MFYIDFAGMPSLKLTPYFHGLKAQQKMPCGHGSTNGNVEKVADVRSRTLSKKSLDQNNYRLCQKELPVSALVLRDSEQRCIIFTLVTLGVDAPFKFLAPFLLPVQGSDCRNLLHSGARSEVDGIGSASPSPTLIFQVDLQKEQGTETLESTGAAKSLSSRSLGPNSLGHSRKRNKRTKSIKSSTTSPVSCFVSDNSSGSASDGLNAVHSDFLISDTPKLENPAKKSSRKKGKKKGKHYKRSLCKKVPIESETKYEEGISGASICDTPIDSDPTGSGDHMSENNLSEEAISSSLLVKDSITEKGESKVSSNGLIESSTDLTVCMSCNDEMDLSEPTASSSQGFTGEEFSCNKLNVDDVSTVLSNTSHQEVILPAVDDNTTNDHPKQDRNSCNFSSSNSLDQSTYSSVDSLRDGWNSDLSEVCSDDIGTRLSIKDENAFSSSESGVDSRINGTDHCISSTYSSNEVIDTYDRAERVQCSSQACSSNDFQPVVYGKKGRLARKTNGSLNSGSRYCSTSFLGRTSKDSNHSVWQKVQKNDAEEGTHESSNARGHGKPSNNLCKLPETVTRLDAFMGMKQNQSEKIFKFFCSDETVVQTDSRAATSSSVGSSELLSKSIDGKVNDVERKPNLASKQANHYSSKGSLTDKVKISKPSKIQIQQKDVSELSQQVTHTKCMSSGMKSPCRTNFQRFVASPTNKPGCRQSAQRQTEIHMEVPKPLRNGSSMAEDMTALVAQNEIHSVVEDNQSRPLLTLDFWGRACLEELSDNGNSKSCNNMHVDYCRPTDIEDDGSMKSESESSHAEHSKPNNCCGSVMQKWVPVGRKDRMEDIADASVSDSSNQKNMEIEVFSSNTHHDPRFACGGLECLSLSSGDMDCRSPETDGLSSEFGSHPQTEEEFPGGLSVSNCNLTHEVTDRCQVGSEDDLDVIVRAVTDAYKFQSASENVCLATGSPVAEFERLLHSASPVLGQIVCVKNCETCPRDQLIGDSLCPHQIPNFSLGNLWHWYEGPGSYGLEVKAEDYNNSKRSRYGHSEFHAYFVPYLSAVQLFARTNNSSGGGNSNEELTGAADVDKKLKKSAHLSSLPIFSKLVPQPCKRVDANFPESTSSTKAELLFEYFESDQPQQRRPLHEKIKELVRGDASSTGSMFGDPLNLECLNLHDLHPASWYSVAWYPIYRIPDGNFRAAFLTYHPLGHLARRKASPSFSGGVTCLVLPVVGLQSYNAQGECWFQPRGLKSQVVQIDALNSSKILEERLRTLEQTAAVMARASVWKGNQRSVNKQPDYEFFISKRR